LTDFQVIEGRIHVGLTAVEIDQLCEWTRSPEYKNRLYKVTTRDLPWAVAFGKSGGTTVAATAFIAHQFGIRVFATGGIGGVHRDGHISMCRYVTISLLVPSLTYTGLSLSK
jgi:pseudouridine-5'-phosphate glycosidase/pseudouridine kinase